MQAIKLNIYQQTANYRVPISHEFRESYPLPPYSTVIGMIHYLCNFKSYHPMAISVQGKSNSTTSDFFTRYEFKNGLKFDPKRHQLDAEGFGISRGIGHTQLLVDMNLVIHVIPENQTELKTIYEALKKPREYPNLGRREDLASFQGVKIVDLKHQHLIQDYEELNSLSAYIPKRLLNGDVGTKDNMGSGLHRGTSYNISNVYKKVEIRKGKIIREWHKVPVLYISNYYIFSGANFLFDSDGMAVFPSLPIEGE